MLFRSAAAAAPEPLPFAVVGADGQPLPPAAPPVPLADEAAAVAEAPPAIAIASVMPALPLPFAIADPADEAALPPLDGTSDVVSLSAPAPQPILRPLPQADAMAEAEPEVIVRMSTSGGRNWGVVLGQHNSRSQAERALMKAGLSDSVALGQGLRKVVARGGAYEATVLGLTQDQADLACRRLQARAQDCITIGP